MQTTLALDSIPILSSPWPCRKGTVDKTLLRFSPISRKDVNRWFYQASRLAAVAAAPGQGRSLLAVFRSLMEYTDWRTGRLDPSYAAIARKARYARSTVHKALRLLREIGVITWIPCCTRGTGPDGRFELRQETNVYVFLPPSQWKGYEEPTPPAPEPEAWGATPPLPSSVEAFTAAKAEGTDFKRRLDLLEVDPTDELAIALARLGRRIAPPT